MEILYNEDTHLIQEKSSIKQFEGFLSVYKQGEYVPISFDVLETAKCTDIKKHRAILALEPWCGYAYPVATCKRSSQDIVVDDLRGVEEKPLPPCQGEGKYLTYTDVNRAVHDGLEFIGVENTTQYRVGLNYYQARDTLQAEE